VTAIKPLSETSLSYHVLEMYNLSGILLNTFQLLAAVLGELLVFAIISHILIHSRHYKYWILTILNVSVKLRRTGRVLNQGEYSQLRFGESKKWTYRVIREYPQLVFLHFNGSRIGCRLID